ncbi:MAG: glycosyltransferase family 39 protein [Chloroflexi bacterium]|nr:glycosyltransferase family 39 protein [Chloroflexota bacterium]
MQQFKQKITTKNSLILIGLTMLALLFRIYRLNNIPPGLSGDEIFNAIDAVRISPGNLPIFIPGNFGREVLFHYVMALFMGLFGQSIWAIRLPAALFGTGNVIFAYLIGRKAFNQYIGTIAGVLVAISLWPLMHSRLALRAVTLTFFSGFIVTSILYGLERNKWGYWILAGIGSGLIFYTYIPGRAFFAVILVWLTLVWQMRRDQISTNWQRMGVMWLLALIIFAPFGWYMWQFPELANQRINTVNVDLLNGNLPSLFLDLQKGIPNVLRMFTIQGDASHYYHLANKPIFDQITGMFFYLGIVIALVRTFISKRKERRPEYPLLWVWLMLMLVPNMLTDTTFAFLRSAGAIIPTYLITAIGIEAVLCGSIKQWQRIRPFLITILILGLVTTAVSTWRDYAIKWAQSPEVIDSYNGELASMGTYLQEADIPEQTRIFLAYDYVYDWPTQFALNLYTDQTVSFYNRATTFAWPANQDSWHLMSHRLPIPPAAAAQLSIIKENDLFSIQQPDSPFSLVPALPVQISFAQAPTLTGLTIPEPIIRGETITLLTHWEIPSGLTGLVNELLFLNIAIQDAQRNLWRNESKIIGYPQASWRAGDQFVQQVSLPISDGMLPGEAALHFSLTRLDGSVVDIVETAVTPPTFLVQNPANFEAYDTANAALVFDDRLAIDQTTTSTISAPGIGHEFSIDWVKLTSDTSPIELQFEIRDATTGKTIATQSTPLGGKSYPYALWQENEKVTTQHRLLMPLNMEGITAVSLHITLHSDTTLNQNSGKLADLTLNQRTHIFDKPAISQAFPATWDDGVDLLGYDIQTNDADLQLTLYWQAKTPPTKNYTIFTHILNDLGEIVAQQDGPPAGEAWLMMTWLPQEIIIDERTIPLPPDLPANTYRIRIGLYDSRTGDRLPVSIENTPQPDAALFLHDVSFGN